MPLALSAVFSALGSLWVEISANATGTLFAMKSLGKAFEFHKVLLKGIVISEM
jgi:hypothetical protein